MRPLLVPGAHVLRRRDGSFQVGLDPAEAVVLPGTPEVGACLARLDGSRLRDSQREPAALLARAGLLLDERAVIPRLADSEGAAARARTAALLRRHRDGAAHVLGERARRPVLVKGFGHPDGAALPARLAALLGEAGLRVAADPAAPDIEPAGEPTVAVLAGLGEPDRELVDGWMRDRVPHLVVRVSEGRATVGPFVVPGETACLRCLDAHHTDADPSWPLLVRQYADACRRPRGDGTPEPLDPLLAAVAVAWAARDLATHVDGGRPSTWSTTLRLGADLAEVEGRTWERHPECGCSWQ